MGRGRKGGESPNPADKGLLDVLLSGMMQGWAASIDGDGNVVFEIPGEGDDDDSSCDDMQFLGGDEEETDHDHDDIYDLVNKIVSVGSSGERTTHQVMEKHLKIGGKKFLLSVSVVEER
eukprot:jgi/Mesvir1/18609/Mv17118-RA.1